MIIEPIKLVLAFLAGGLISAIVQVFIDKTALTPARILVSLVVSGVFLYAVGVYEPLRDIFGAGVSTPLLGFGAAIAKGVKEAIKESGPIGILTGGLTATAGGITTALLVATLLSAVYRGRARRMGRARR